jgi:hypothetical protein
LLISDDPSGVSPLKFSYVVFFCRRVHPSLYSLISHSAMEVTTKKAMTV